MSTKSNGNSPSDKVGNDKRVIFMLCIAFLLIIIIVLSAGIFGILKIGQSAKTTSLIYHHPLTVSNAVRDIKINTIMIHREMKDLATTTDPKEMSAHILKVEELEKETIEKFTLVENRYLGKLISVKEAKDEFLTWKHIRTKVIELHRQGEYQKAILITKSTGAQHVELIISKVDTLIDFASNKGTEFLEDAESSNREYIISSVALLGLSVLGSIFLAMITTKYISTYQSDLYREKIKSEQAGVAKDHFLSSVSHEIRTPMNGIIGMTSVIKETKLDDIQQECMDVIDSSSQNLITLINDILDFSKIEHEEMKVETVAFDLLQLLEETAEMFNIIAEEKNIKIILGYMPSNLRYQKGDPQRFKQVLVNLIGNALKFTESGYILIGLDQVEENMRKYLQISIEDTGIGLPEGQIEELFEKFTQGDSSLTRKYSGLGLGLAISRNLIELMGGKIVGSNRPSGGASFKFTLPLDETMKGLPLKREEIQRSPIDIFIILKSDKEREISENYFRDGAQNLYSYGSLEEASGRIRECESDKKQKLIIFDEEIQDISQEAFIEEFKRHHLYVLKKKNSLIRLSGLRGTITKPLYQSKMTKVLDQLFIGNKKEDEKGEELNMKDHLMFKGSKILVVDDNSMNRKVAQKILERLGCEVHLASDGKEGLHKATQGTYNMILMDIQMPEMDGLEATSYLRGNEDKKIASIPVVAMTANSMAGDREKYLAGGMDDYISKPVNKGEFMRVLKKYI